ncbi:uncharacterized protein LOC141908318 [Tubulanus polymorphus]|uniref:uncharacterized protein LOC141908318 n=1 Tax=Tubulanus polymorphus TaxID=672921 RepID=UPI003DA26EC0
MASSKIQKLPENHRHEATVLLTLFNEADKNNDGFLTIDELRLALQNNPRPDIECQDLFDALDADEDGKVSKEEYITGLMKGCYAKQELRAIFKKIDKNGDGFIDINEFKQAFEECGSKGYDCSYFEEKIREFDTNSDLKLDWNEFLDFSSKGKK